MTPPPETAKILVTEQCANKLGDAVINHAVPDSDEETYRAMLQGVAWAAQHLRGKV